LNQENNLCAARLKALKSQKQNTLNYCDLLMKIFKAMKR